MRTAAILLAVALGLPTVASAQQVDFFDATLQPVSNVWTGAPYSSNGNWIQDIKATPDGSVWTVIAGSLGSQCSTYSDVVRITPAGVVEPQNLDIMQPVGIAVGPNQELFIARTAYCVPDGNGGYTWDRNADTYAMYLERFAPGTTTSAQTQSWVRYYGSIDRGVSLFTAPDDSILYSDRYAIRDLAPTSTATVISATHDRFTNDFAYNAATGEVLRLNYVTNTSVTDPYLSRWSAGTAYPGHAWTADAVNEGSVNLTTLGITSVTQVTALPNGNILLVGEVPYNAADQGPYQRFGVKYYVVDSDITTLLDQGWLRLSAESFRSMTTDASGRVVIASTSRSRIADPVVTVSDTTPGAAATFEVRFTLPVDLPANHAVGFQLDTDIDNSQATVELVSGIDGTATFSPGGSYFENNYGQTNRGLYAWRQSGSTIPAGTEVVFRINDVVLPATPGTIAVTHVVHRPHPTDYYQTDAALSLNGVASFDIADGISCAVGYDPVDLDDDGTADSCVHPSATVDASADVEPGAIIGDGVVIEPYATVGAGAILGDGAFVAARAIVAEGVQLGAGSVVGRRANIGPRTVIGADSVIARSAVIGADSSLPPGSSVGYGASVGDFVVVDQGLTLGSLTTLGGTGAASGAVSCVGPLTVARGSAVGALSPFTLSCSGSAIIGPDVQMGADAILGTNFRIRKDGVVGTGFVAGDDVKIGRSANVGNGVILPEDLRVGANARLCDDFTTTEAALPRTFVDPTCE